MKRTIFLLLISILTLQIQAQDQRTSNEFRTVLGPGCSHGGYGSLDFRYGIIDKRDAMVVGGRGAWVINHALSLGIAGYGFFTDYIRDYEKNRYHNLQGGYGGLYFEPIIAPRAPVHFSVPLLLGIGGVVYTTSYHDNYKDPWPYNDEHQNIMVDDWDAYFIFKPGFEVELNVLRFFRIGVGGYYNFTSDINMINTSRNALDGFEAGVSLKFGKF